MTQIDFTWDCPECKSMRGFGWTNGKLESLTAITRALSQSVSEHYKFKHPDKIVPDAELSVDITVDVEVK